MIYLLVFTPFTVIVLAQLQLGAGREHTKAYLESYESGKPCPPVQYYRKVAVKDKPDQLLSGKQLEAFNHIIS